MPASATQTGSPEAALERATFRTVTLRLIPFLFLLYVIAFLDRVNLGFAALQMNHDLGFSATVYGFGSGIFFVGYSLFELPSNLVLVRVGPRRWIARIMITWGLLASAMMFVSSPLSFYVIRFLLGVAEAGFFPGIIYYLTCWFPAEQRGRAVARFMAAIPIAGVVSGSLAGVLLGLHGKAGLAGWQWLFLLEGLPAIVCGFVVLKYLPDGPETALWLPPEGRAWLVARLREARAHCEKRHGLSLRQALLNRTMWQLTLIYLLTSTSFYAYSFWSPQFIKGFVGGSNTMAGLASAAISLVVFAYMVLNGAHSDRHREPYRHAAIPALISGLGWFLGAWLRTPVPGLLSLALVPLVLAGNGPFWSLPASFLTGRTAAGGIAFINTLGAMGGFVGSNLLGMVKDATGDFRAAQLVLAICCLVSAIMLLRLRSAPELAVDPAALELRRSAA